MAFAEFIISFREFFEAAIIIGIILAYLSRSSKAGLSRFVYLGAGAAAFASIALAFLFESIAGGFEAHEALFEGVLLVFSSALITSLIFWMLGKRGMREHISRGAHSNSELYGGAGILAFSFFAVLREGVEIILFFAGIKLATNSLELGFALAGALCAILLAGAITIGLVRLKLSMFFTITAFLLVLMAGGLLGQGVHELEEAGILPPLIEHVYDFNPPHTQGQDYPPMHEKGIVGGTMKALLGYDANPSLLQLSSQAGYYALAFIYWRKSCK